MARRRLTAMLVCVVACGIGAGPALAAIPTLKSTPPSSLGSGSAGSTRTRTTPSTTPVKHKPKPKPKQRPKPKRTPAAAVKPARAARPAAQGPTPRHTVAPPGSLPMTGDDLPLELVIGAGLALAGLGLRRFSRRPHRF